MHLWGWLQGLPNLIRKKNVEKPKKQFKHAQCVVCNGRKQRKWEKAIKLQSAWKWARAIKGPPKISP